MPRFEKRITDEEIAAAREQIAAGMSLRDAATEIGCAPSTLSYRIRRAIQAEAAESMGNVAPTARPGVLAPSAGSDAGTSQPGPLDVLREALQATKADGQPHWPTRISAARTIATLRPEELDPKETPEPLITVYDLPPGATSVLHRARSKEAERQDGAESPPQVQEHVGVDQLPRNTLTFLYLPPPESDDPGGTIGEFKPAIPGGFAIVFTHDPEEAASWRADLIAGRVPQRDT
jgi:hypothetical protein